MSVPYYIALQGRPAQTVISEVNTAPMHTSANASPRHHWSSRHSSGPERIATPFSVEDLALSLTSYSMLVLGSAFRVSRFWGNDGVVCFHPMSFYTEQLIDEGFPSFFKRNFQF